MDNLETSGRPNESADATAKRRRRRNLFTVADALWKVGPPLIVFTVRLILIYSDRLHNGAAHLGPRPPAPHSAGSFRGPSLYFLNTSLLSLGLLCLQAPHGDGLHGHQERELHEDGCRGNVDGRLRHCLDGQFIYSMKSSCHHAEEWGKYFKEFHCSEQIRESV